VGHCQNSRKHHTNHSLHHQLTLWYENYHSTVWWIQYKIYHINIHILHQSPGLHLTDPSLHVITFMTCCVCFPSSPRKTAGIIEAGFYRLMCPNWHTGSYLSNWIKQCQNTKSRKELENLSTLIKMQYHDGGVRTLH